MEARIQPESRPPTVIRMEGIHRTYRMGDAEIRALDGVSLEVAAGDFVAGSEIPVDVSMVGKKGVAFFRFLGNEMAETLTDIADAPRFEQVEPLANRLMDRFAAGELATVDVAYTQFISSARQRAVVERILPLQAEVEEEGEAAGLEYEFSPAPQELLEERQEAIEGIRLFPQRIVVHADARPARRVLAGERRQVDPGKFCGPGIAGDIEVRTLVCGPERESEVHLLVRGLFISRIDTGQVAPCEP